MPRVRGDGDRRRRGRGGNPKQSHPRDARDGRGRGRRGDDQGAARRRGRAREGGGEATSRTERVGPARRDAHERRVRGVQGDGRAEDGLADVEGDPGASGDVQGRVRRGPRARVRARVYVSLRFPGVAAERRGGSVRAVRVAVARRRRVRDVVHNDERRGHRAHRAVAEEDGDEGGPGVRRRVSRGQGGVRPMRTRPGEVPRARQTRRKVAVTTTRRERSST
mmetsp:Transcript_7234/g.26512  ORF Transcript_7234/g.26512 Transcript_7234/m.26512 type:complete len:222 (+) Transcript_7234:734-1399(+)